MQIVLKKDLLKTTLEKISTSLGGSDADPIHGHFLFRVGEDSIEVLSGGGAVGLCGYVKIENLPPTDVEKTLSFTVEGANLLGFLGDVTGDAALHIEYDTDKDQVSVKPDTSNTTLTTGSLKPSSFPDFETDFKAAKEKGDKGTFKSESLEEAFRFAQPFIGTGLSNAGFGLVKLSDDSTLRSGDGKSVAVFKRDGFSGEARIRGEKLSNVLAFLKPADDDYTLYEGENNYFIEDGEGHYYGFKKVSYDFPEMKGLDLFDTGTMADIIEVDASSLKGALHRLRWALDSDQVRMGFSLPSAKGNDGSVTAEMVISATNNNTQAVSEEKVDVVRVKGEEETTFFLNYNYVIKGIDKFTEDRIRVYLNREGFSYVKILETVDEGGTEVVRILLLALMKRPR